jgi:hypothetical protein
MGPYQPGDKIEGVVQLSLSRDIKARGLLAFLCVEQEKTKFYANPHGGYHQESKENLQCEPLILDVEKVYRRSDSMEYKFDFTIPDVPYHKHDENDDIFTRWLLGTTYGRIETTLEVKLDIPNRLDISSKEFVDVVT